MTSFLHLGRISALFSYTGKWCFLISADSLVVRYLSMPFPACICLTSKLHWFTKELPGQFCFEISIDPDFGKLAWSYAKTSSQCCPVSSTCTGSSGMALRFGSRGGSNRARFAGLSSPSAGNNERISSSWMIGGSGFPLSCKTLLAAALVNIFG